MSSKVPTAIRWTRNKTTEELLDNPLAEFLYMQFMKVKDSPRHISIKPELLINEAYHISNLLYQDDNPIDSFDYYIHEIELDLGWKYAIELVMTMVFVLLNSQKRKPKKIISVIDKIELLYHNNIYWDTFNSVGICSSSPKRKLYYTYPKVFDTFIQQYNKQVTNVVGKSSCALNITINLNNEFKGDINNLNLAHADVAVGVAEAGSNVFHHKIEENGR